MTTKLQTTDSRDMIHTRANTKPKSDMQTGLID